VTDLSSKTQFRNYARVVVNVQGVVYHVPNVWLADPNIGNGETIKAGDTLWLHVKKFSTEKLIEFEATEVMSGSTGARPSKRAKFLLDDNKTYDEETYWQIIPVVGRNKNVPKRKIGEALIRVGTFVVHNTPMIPDSMDFRAMASAVVRPRAPDWATSYKENLTKLPRCDILVNFA